jgi:DNA polymerase III psi subunit
MNESRRRAYLDAMGLDVWLMKPPETEKNRLMISRGEGSTLLICNSAGESSTRLAGDIARTMGGDPVWAWPDPDGRQDCPTLQQAVSQFLFTRVVLFGSSLGQSLFDTQVPEVLASAGILVTASLDELAVNSSARQKLWERILEKRFN